jgi:hypothetical protein
MGRLARYFSPMPVFSSGVGIQNDTNISTTKTTIWITINEGSQHTGINMMGRIRAFNSANLGMCMRMRIRPRYLVQE